MKLHTALVRNFTSSLVWIDFLWLLVILFCYRGMGKFSYLLICRNNDWLCWSFGFMKLPGFIHITIDCYQCDNTGQLAIVQASESSSEKQISLFWEPLNQQTNIIGWSFYIPSFSRILNFENQLRNYDFTIIFVHMNSKKCILSHYHPCILQSEIMKPMFWYCT